MGTSYHFCYCSLLLLFFGYSISEISLLKLHAVLTSLNYLSFLSDKSENSVRGPDGSNLLKIKILLI